MTADETGAIGARRQRREDRGLLTGAAEFTDDIVESDLAHLAILRSRVAHARLRDVDTSRAEALDGVLTVLTGEDLRSSAIPGTVPVWLEPPESGGPYTLHTGPHTPRRPLLAQGRSRYTGEAVAAVVATGRAVAQDALARIDVDYDRLEAITDPSTADEAGAPRLHETVPDNTAFAWSVGDAEATEAAFARADRTVGFEASDQRLIPSPLEPRAAIADHRPADDRLVVRLNTQVPHETRRYLADALGRPAHTIRVVAPRVGGGFGTKEKFYPAEAIAAWAATRVGRPVKWVATRTDDFAAGIHGRDYRKRGELALAESGNLLGLRTETRANLGAYPSKDAPMIATAASHAVATGQYAIPAVHSRVTGVLTNTAPVDAYRGSGRPESIYVLERLVDRAAAELGLDPAALRRRNLLSPDEFPYLTPTGYRYDSGDYEPALDRALEVAEYEAFRDRQGRLRDEGRFVGLGLACYVEGTGIELPETSTVRVHRSGAVTAFAGTADQGQGHATTYAQILSEKLGLPEDDIVVREGDTEHLRQGTGTYASRSTMAAGRTLVDCADQLIEKCRRMAASELEVAPADLRFAGGEFSVAGSPARSIAIPALAELAYAPRGRPADVELGLETTITSAPDAAFPFGCHVAAVEVDPRTGDVDLTRYVAVDDCGNRVNPAIVEGQVHGGVAQGVGQALLERAVYDDTGNLLTGSLQDYALPRAGDLPDIETAATTTPSPIHPLGVKGIGENATIPAPAAVVNAVIDALEPLGVDHVERPVTPERVWRAIQGADGESRWGRSRD